MEVINAIGRRKAAVARVYVSEGKGNITINKRPLEEYFTLPTLQLKYPPKVSGSPLTGSMSHFPVLQSSFFSNYPEPISTFATSEALRLGIARALVEINAEDKAKLRAAGFMTRDPREVERKKPGRPKARKRFQFSKR